MGFLGGSDLRPAGNLSSCVLTVATADVELPGGWPSGGGWEQGHPCTAPMLTPPPYSPAVFMLAQ